MLIEETGRCLCEHRITGCEEAVDLGSFLIRKRVGTREEQGGMAGAAEVARFDLLGGNELRAEAEVLERLQPAVANLGEAIMLGLEAREPSQPGRAIDGGFE